MRLGRDRGPALTGPDGLLKQLTRTVIETALDEEMTGHMGYEKHDPAGPGRGQRERPERDPARAGADRQHRPGGIEVPRHLRDAKSLHGL